MKKRLWALVLTLCLVCALCACGDSGNITPEEPPETTPVQTVTPTPAQSPTPTPESSYPSDTSEPNASEPSNTPEPSEPKKLEGLIFACADMKMTPQATRKIYCFNPETGDETLISDFSFSGDDYVYGFETVCWYKFSSDFSKMMIDKRFDNGEIHAGWLDTNGNFFDVTGALGLHAQSDFDDTLSCRSVGFSGNLFGYRFQERSGGPIVYNYVPIDNITPGEIQEGYVLEVNHPFNEYGRLIEGNWFGEYFATDVTCWIDDVRCLVNDSGGSGINSIMVDAAAQTTEAYIPGNSRSNWNGVVSPDGTKIAFMSTIGPEHDRDVDIYIVPINGGDPVKVTGYSFAIADWDLSRTGLGTYKKQGYVLIGWI